MGAADKYLSTHSLDFDNIDEEGDVIRRNVILLNSEVMPGAPYFTLTWFLKATGISLTSTTSTSTSDSSDPTRLIPPTSTASCASWWTTSGSP